MSFNAKKFAEENPIQSQLPLGHYKVEVESAEEKTSSTGYGMYTLKIRILESLRGGYANALQWENLVVGHDSEQTQKYAYAKLTEIMLAAGVDEFIDASDLQQSLKNIPITMTIAQAKSGRYYAMYRPLQFYIAASQAVGNTPPVDDAPTIPAMPPMPDIDDYIDDIPF